MCSAPGTDFALSLLTNASCVLHSSLGIAQFARSLAVNVVCTVIICSPHTSICGPDVWYVWIILRAGADSVHEAADSFVLAILWAALTALVEPVQPGGAAPRREFANVVFTDASTAAGWRRVARISKTVAVLSSLAVAS